MSNGPIPFTGDTWYAWGQGTDGQALLLQATGETLDGLALFRVVPGDAAAAGGYWEPVTNGDPVSPEVVFDMFGDIVMGFVTP